MHLETPAVGTAVAQEVELVVLQLKGWILLSICRGDLEQGTEPYIDDG